MFLGTLLIVLPGALGLVAALANLKNGKRPTFWGYTIIFMSVAQCLLQGIQLGSVERRAAEARYVFNLADLEFTVYARHLGVATDEAVLASTPKAFTVGYAAIGRLATEFNLTRVEGVTTPSGFHGLSSGTLTYRSGRIRVSKIGSTTAPPFAYIWDLNGQQVLFSIPTQKFSTYSEPSRWLFWTEMRVGVHRFQSRADDRGQISFSLDGLSKSDVMTPAP